MSKIENKQEETQNEEHVEEEEVLDEETTNKLRNLTVDDAMFTGQSKTKGQNQKGEKKSKKNKRGVDFLDYAKSNGIDVKLQYEDTTNEKREYKDYSANKNNYNRSNKEDGNKPYFNKRENYGNNKEGEERTRGYQNYPSQNKDEGVEVTPQVTSSDFIQNNNYNYQQKINYKNNQAGNSNNYHNKKHFHNNYNQNQGYGHSQREAHVNVNQGTHNNNYQYNNNSQINNYSNTKPQYGNNTPSNNKLSSTNKFDSMNAQSDNNYNISNNNVNYSQHQMINMGYNSNAYNSYGNPYAQQESQMNQMQNNPQAMFLYQQQMMEAYRKQMMMYQQNTQEQIQNEAGSVLETLHYYFSEENLNKDYYMRSNLDSEGFLKASNIIRFNKMKAKGVTVEMIEEILKNKSSDLIEFQVMSEGQLFMRNKEWDSFKDNLVHIDVLQQQQQQRNLIKRGNYNQNTQVNPNNNYYGGMYAGQMDGMQNYGMMGYNMNMNMNMGMNMGVNPEMQGNYVNYNMYGNKRDENEN